MASSLTLESTVGTGGPRAAVETDALLNAVRRNGDEVTMRGFIADFLVDDFKRQAVSENVIDPKAAARWMSENQDVMARFPELRRDISEAIKTGGALTDTQRIADPRVSRAAVFINAPPGEEIERVLNTARPREAMAELVKLVRQDPTGKAERGLKAAFFEMLLGKSTVKGGTKSLDVNEIPFISGARLTEEMNRNTTLEGMRGLFSSDEFIRLNKIRETALLLDKARLSPKSAEGIIGDQPGKLMEIVARIGGAQLGRVIAGKTGGGTVQTPGILSAHVRKLLQSGIQDPTARLLTDSIFDEGLFKALLIDQSSAASRKATQARINAWAIDVLRQQESMAAEEIEK